MHYQGYLFFAVSTPKHGIAKASALSYFPGLAHPLRLCTSPEWDSTIKHCPCNCPHVCHVTRSCRCLYPPFISYPCLLVIILFYTQFIMVTSSTDLQKLSYPLVSFHHILKEHAMPFPLLQITFSHSILLDSKRLETPRAICMVPPGKFSRCGSQCGSLYYLSRRQIMSQEFSLT